MSEPISNNEQVPEDTGASGSQQASDKPLQGEVVPPAGNSPLSATITDIVESNPRAFGGVIQTGLLSGIYLERATEVRDLREQCRELEAQKNIACQEAAVLRSELRNVRASKNASVLCGTLGALLFGLAWEVGRYSLPLCILLAIVAAVLCLVGIFGLEKDRGAS